MATTPTNQTTNTNTERDTMTTTNQAEQYAENWVKVSGEPYGTMYRVEPGAIVTGYLHTGDEVPGDVTRHAVPGPWVSLGALRAAHERAGKFYFAHDTSRFFGARYNDMIAGRFLVDSVQPPYGPREYRVSVWDDDAAVGCERVGTFETLAAARRFARSLVAEAFAEFADVVPA